MVEPVFLIAIGLLLVTSILLIIGYQIGTRRTRKSAAELSALNDIGLELLRTQLNVEKLAELVYERAKAIVPTDFFQLGLFDGDAYRVVVWVVDGERRSLQIFPESGRQGVVGWVRANGVPLVVEDFQDKAAELPSFPQFTHENPPRSGLFVPLVAGDDTIGVIAVQSRQVRRFDSDHLRLLVSLSNLAASSIRNAQLYHRAQHRAEQLNLVGQVSAQVSSVQPLPAFFNQVATLIQDTFGYYAVSVLVASDSGDHLTMGASSAGSFRGIARVDLGQGMIGWAAQRGMTALANNVATDARYRKLGVLPETRSEIALPLKVEDRVLGVLDVQSDRVDAFGAEDVFLLETLASQIALAIEQAQTYAGEYTLAQRLEALMEVSQAIVSELDLDDLLDRLVELIAETFEFERVHIFIRIGDMLVFRAGTGPHSVRWLINELAYALDDSGLIPLVGRTASSVIVDDVTQSDDFVPGEGIEDSRSEMVLPIQMAGRVMGVLDIQSVEEAAFSEDDLLLMQSLADSVAVALRNAALYANERRRRNLADALREVSASLAAELELDDIIAEILEGMRRVLTLNTAAILLFGEMADTLTIYAATGPNLEGYIGFRRTYEDLDRSDEDTVHTIIRNLYQELLDLPEDQTLITVPLTVGGEVIGYVVADQPYVWLHSSDDFEIVSAFANQAAIAISNSRLYSAQQAEAYVTTVLLQIAEAVNAQADISEALETIARLTALLAGVGRCLILRWEDETSSYHFSAQYGIARDKFLEAQQISIAAEDHPLLDLLSVADRPLGAGKGYQLPVPSPLAELLPTSSVLCFPLQAKRGLVGLLVVDEPRQDSNPRMMTILTGIAQQTATIFETAILQTSASERERLEQELEVARRIQASFIPDLPPQLDGWEIAAHWQSARQVSGDFYDFIPLPDGLWGMLIADVADKGTPAALFMAVCRTLMRAAALTRTSPAETLMRVNEFLFSDSRTDLFVTIFYTVWDPRTGQVTYASGGHNPALLVRSGESAIEMKCNGIALGVIPDINLEDQQLTMAPGDTLVAYTDGVTEAMQEDYTEWGLDRFKHTLHLCQTDQAPVMLQRILDEIETFVGGAPQSDDLTIWLLKRESTQGHQPL